ncbi:hypothetical protein Pyn_18715 [Prunus yedoensis var. nudiflora]|uniref:Uncharacterized protein n=1 Tax=Prunus yedoensis var. nudiflora TaxID=2094558 RepID=A0A314U7K4_PRUYE|nr:hypothetical protein Pyn_18715 [Prunus yedoensis var. nudiflora]
MFKESEGNPKLVFVPITIFSKKLQRARAIDELLNYLGLHLVVMVMEGVGQSEEGKRKVRLRRRVLGKKKKLLVP